MKQSALKRQKISNIWAKGPKEMRKKEGEENGWKKVSDVAVILGQNILMSLLLEEVRAPLDISLASHVLRPFCEPHKAEITLPSLQMLFALQSSAAAEDSGVLQPRSPSSSPSPHCWGPEMLSSVRHDFSCPQILALVLSSGSARRPSCWAPWFLSWVPSTWTALFSAPPRVGLDLGWSPVYPACPHRAQYLYSYRNFSLTVGNFLGSLQITSEKCHFWRRRECAQ